MHIATDDSKLLKDVTLAVIAGGMGTRMGKPKAWLRVGEQSILGWVLGRLQWPGPTLLVTAPAVLPPPDESRFDRHVQDPVDGLGPLRGVLTAMEFSNTPIVVTIAVDMPLLERSHLAWLTRQLLERPECLGAMSEFSAEGEQHIEPFPAAYRAESASFLSSQLVAGQRSLHRLCRDPRFSAIPVPADWSADMWTNLNDPKHLAGFEAATAAPRQTVP